MSGLCQTGADPIAAGNGPGSSPGWLIRRPFAFVGRHPSLIYVLLALLAFPIGESIIFRTNAVQYVHDVLDSDVPNRIALVEAWGRAGFSLWNPGLTAGNATLAQGALPPTTPDVLLDLLVFTPFESFVIAYWLLIALAGYGMHRFLRDSLSLPTLACVGGAVVYAFSFWHYIHGFGIALLPLLLWLTDRWLAAPDWRSRSGPQLVLVSAFMLYTGLLQLVIVGGAVQLAYLLATARPRLPARAILARWVGQWALAGGLFAPVLFTQVVALGESHRSILDVQALIPSSWDAVLGRWAGVYSSLLVGVPTAIGTGTAGFAGTFFMGAVSLPLLIAGLAAPRPHRRWRFLLVLLLAIPILDLLASLATPLFAQLGPLGSFQLERVRHVMPFVLAANVAVGFAAVAGDGWRTIVRRRAWTVALIAAFAVIAVQLVTAAGHALAPEAGSSLNADGWRLAMTALVGGAVLSGVIFATRSWRPAMSGLPVATLMAMLLIVLVTERATYARAERYLQHPSQLGTWAAEITVDPAKAYIAAQPESNAYRTLAAGEHPNQMLLADLEEAGGYQSMYPLRYHELYGLLTDPYLVTDRARWIYFHRWGNRAYVFGVPISPPIADLLGVRWIYAARMRFDAPFEPVFTSQEVTVYENPDAFPRAFVASDLRLADTAGELHDALADATPDVLRRTAFVLRSDWGSQPAIGPAGSTGSVAVVADSPDEIVLAADLDAPGVVILRDTIAAGWTVTVDGEAAELIPADIALRAVRVPAGVSEVRFAYRPWFTYSGAVLAGMTLVALLTWMGTAGRASRRATRAPGR